MIILQFDHNYYRWGNLMLRSLALHEPNQRLLADTVNLLPEQVAELRQMYPGLIVQNDITGTNPTAVQMANRKALVLQKALDAYPDEPWYGLFDADFLVRRPLTSLWSLLDEHQAALLLTNGLWDGQVYPRLITLSGMVLVRTDGRLLIDNWAKWYWYDRPIDTIQPRQ